MQAHGVLSWGSFPGASDAVFDFGSLAIDFTAGVPEEVIAYMSNLPDELVRPAVLAGGINCSGIMLLKLRVFKVKHLTGILLVIAL